MEPRSFSKDQINLILNFLNEKNIQVILIGEPDKIKSLQTTSNTYIHIDDDINSAIALLSQSDLVVSVDTSIVHFSRCFDKKLICVYTNLIYGKFINNHLWAPMYKNAIQLFSPTNNVKDFDVLTINKEINKYLLNS